MVDPIRLLQINLRLSPSEVERLDALADKFELDRSSAMRLALLIASRAKGKLSAADELAVTARHRRGPAKPRPDADS